MVGQHPSDQRRESHGGVRAGEGSTTDRLIARGQQASDQAVQSTREMVDYMEDKMQHKAHGAVEGAKEGGQRVRAAASDVANTTTKHEAGSLLEEAASAISEGLNVIKRTFTGTKDKVVEEGREVGKKADDYANKAADRTVELEEQMKGVMHKAVESTKANLETIEAKNRELKQGREVEHSVVDDAWAGLKRVFTGARHEAERASQDTKQAVAKVTDMGEGAKTGAPPKDKWIYYDILSHGGES